ncbi:DUF998 domain-containing protein [Agaribacterium haliotis]|uniref:DUF998 domain-containing protein n=1 Tax=Agaribacterium haliotis TaxID=2013869 RepID=UPI001177828D|nr:DUF998 domain-containing protein [Agaribacterium haliotis]
MNRHLSISYLGLRRLIGVIAIVHPALLYFGGLFIFGLSLQPSMSHYYYTGMRDVFVGIDVCTGVFLLCYHGYSWQDRLLSLLAGVSAIIVALFPTLPLGEASDLQKTIAAVHAAAAIVFLICLAVFCLVLFVRSDAGQVISRQKRWRNRLYRLCGANIVLVLVVLGLYGCWPTMQDRLSQTPFIFYLECLAFLSFGLAWLVKGQALLADVNQQHASSR